MSSTKLTIMIMSGVEDGTLLTFDRWQSDGVYAEERWSLSIGRKEENDLILRNDTYISRYHARLHLAEDQWWLEDRDSTNGTFLENPEDFFDDMPVKGYVKIRPGQLFRVGRTWMRINITDA